MDILGLLGILGILVGIIFLIVSIIKKQSKNKALLITGVSLFVLAGATLLITPAPKIELSDKVIETDSSGLALIKGTTNEESTIRVDNNKVKIKNRTFSYSFQLKDNQPKKVTLVASVKDSDKTVIVEIKPSKEFIAFLSKEAQIAEEKEAAKTALILAEKEPTKKNYDEAATLITSLTKEQKDYKKRLMVVKEHIAIYTAVHLAEQEQTKASLDSATALVATATLNKNDLTQRLNKIQKNITEKEQLEKKIAAAREAVEKAEQDPNDDNYSQAIAKINEIPNGNTSFSDRIGKVKETLNTQKETAKLQAEAQKKAEDAALAAQTQAAEAAKAQAEAQPVSEKVLITRTGKKYHTHKCGNGDYFESTLAIALSQGLEPCSKCY